MGYHEIRALVLASLMHTVVVDLGHTQEVIDDAEWADTVAGRAIMLETAMIEAMNANPYPSVQNRVLAGAPKPPPKPPEYRTT